MTHLSLILVPETLSAAKVSDLCDDIDQVEGITQVVSLDAITGPGFDTQLLPEDVLSWCRLAATS